MKKKAKVTNTAMKVFEDFCTERLDLIIKTGQAPELRPDEVEYFKNTILHELDWMEGYGYTDRMADEISNSRADACIDFTEFLTEHVNDLCWDGVVDEDSVLLTNQYDSSPEGLYLLQCVYEGCVVDKPLYDYCDSIVFEIEEEAGRCG